MDEKFGRQTPGLGRLKKSLDQVRELVEKIVKEKRIEEPDWLGRPAKRSATRRAGSAGVPGPPARSGPARTR